MARMEQARATEVAATTVIFAAIIAFVFLVRLYPEPAETHYDGVRLDTDAIYVSSRLWDEGGLRWLSQSDREVTLDIAMPQLAPGARYVVLVHGHDAPENRLASYFHDIVRDTARLSGRKVIIYDWTSVDTNFDIALQRSESREAAWALNALSFNGPVRDPAVTAGQWQAASYRLDQTYASASGAAGLAALLEALATTGAKDIELLGHSMGCRVIAETFRQYPTAATKVERVIMLAPDVSSALWDDPKLRASDLAKTKFEVFYSRHDDILRLLSTTANLEHRLGATGASGSLPLPANVILHDVSALTETASDVHGWYKTKAGADRLNLTALLR